MPFDGAPQTPELFGVGIAAGFAPQFPAFLDEGLLERDPGELGGLHDLGPSDLQQSAIDRMGDGFLLNGAVDDDSFELDRPYRFRCDGGVDGGLEQFFDTGFADGGTKAADLGGTQGSLGSSQVCPLKYCQTTFSAQRSTTSSSLRW